MVTEFERTPSINFQRAVELAKNHPGFMPLMDERNILVYRNIYREGDLLQFQVMYKLIKNWKGAKLYIKGEQVDFDMIGSGIQCYLQTLSESEDTLRILQDCDIFKQDAPDLSGCFGCRRSHVSMEWRTSQTTAIAVWFAFGSLDHNQVYNIHKSDLESAAIGELVEYRYCPLLDLGKIRELIRRLPGRIDPRKDREWKYNRKRKNRFVSPQFRGIFTKEPEIIPISEESYREYLKRKLS